MIIPLLASIPQDYLTPFSNDFILSINCPHEYCRLISVDHVLNKRTSKNMNNSVTWHPVASPFNRRVHLEFI